MIELLDKLELRVAAAVAGLAFDDPANPGETRPPRVVRGGLPPKRGGGTAQGEDFPFVIVRPAGGAGSRKDTRPAFRLIGGVYTAGAISDGLDAIDQLLEALLGLWDQRAFTPYRLTDDVAWSFGDDRDHVQPHPYYYLTMDMTFVGAPRAGVKR